MQDAGTMMMPTPRSARVLHVVVGHGLPAYFRNAIKSVRATAQADHVLVVDNASPQPELIAELADMAKTDPLLDLIIRDENDTELNGKVGSLYKAYELAFSEGIRRGFDLIHLIQNDFQTLWWDAELIARAAEIFDAFPRCVNMIVQLFPRDRVLDGEFEPAGDSGLLKLRHYGLTDVGLYHLGRWQALGMEFSTFEQGHARKYLAAGLEVICHPWPADAQIPWPAVVRRGVQKGREVPCTKPYLLRPPSAVEIARLKQAPMTTWLEDLCIPWGWVCATPMWITGIDSMDYWSLRYRDARRNGLSRLVPKLETRGVDRGDRRRLLRIYHYRPSLFQLIMLAALKEIGLRLRRLRRT